jgi:hypothetical protein
MHWYVDGNCILLTKDRTVRCLPDGFALLRRLIELPDRSLLWTRSRGLCRACSCARQCCGEYCMLQLLAGCCAALRVCVPIDALLFLNVLRCCCRCCPSLGRYDTKYTLILAHRPRTTQPGELPYEPHTFTKDLEITVRKSPLLLALLSDARSGGVATSARALCLCWS